MPPSFIVEFASLLLLGPYAATLVVIAGTVTAWRVRPAPFTSVAPIADRAGRRHGRDAGGGLAYQSLGGAADWSAWPWHGLPIAAAVVVYCVVKSASAEIVVPLDRETADRSIVAAERAPRRPGLLHRGQHRRRARRGDRPPHLGILPVVAVPLYFCYRAYRAHVKRLEEERRRREVIDVLDRACASSTSTGGSRCGTTSSNGCWAAPANVRWAVRSPTRCRRWPRPTSPRAINEALAQRAPRTLADLRLASAAGVRMLDVKFVPVADGVTLLWHDVTERIRAEHSLKRSEERLALAADGRERRAVGMESSHQGVLLSPTGGRR